MTGDDDQMNVELRLAKAYRQEGEQLRKEAAADLEAARYERGQAARDRAEIAVIEKSVAQREQRLAQLNETELANREQAVAAKLVEVKALLADFNNTKHEAAKALVAINAREAAEAARQVAS